MGLKDDLDVEIQEIFKTEWDIRDGTVVPDDTSVTFGNDAVKITATVLYADMADSTRLVDGYKAYFAAEVYKSFLRCAARVIRSEGGVITAYDGDRIMAVFIGNSKNTSAVRAALKINYAVREIVRPAMTQRYPTVKFVPMHVVGVDTSELFVVKTGVRGANDLVWTGRAANYAAKLSSLGHDYNTQITKTVFDGMHDSVKKTGDKSMWEAATWTVYGDTKVDIYRSTWQWSVD